MLGTYPYKHSSNTHPHRKCRHKRHDFPSGRETCLQLSPKNKDIEIMTDYPERKVKRLEELVPDWWGWKRYRESGRDQDAN